MGIAVFTGRDAQDGHLGIVEVGPLGRCPRTRGEGGQRIGLGHQKATGIERNTEGFFRNGETDHGGRCVLN